MVELGASSNYRWVVKGSFVEKITASSWQVLYHRTELRRCEASLHFLQAKLVFQSYSATFLPAGNFRHPPCAGFTCTTEFGSKRRTGFLPMWIGSTGLFARGNC